MKIPRGNAVRTRGRLLVAAGKIFARKGYRDATIAEICKQAGANIAAVNYHFGSKEAIYREAWRSAFSESLRIHPPDGGIAEEAPAEERLHGQIKALLNRIADENNLEFWVMQREFINPTGLLEEVMREEMRPLQKRMESLVREFLGPGVSDREVLFCEVSIISQCINPLVARNKQEEEHETGEGPSEIDDIDAYARHITAFSLAGIRAVRAAADRHRKY